MPVGGRWVTWPEVYASYTPAKRWSEMEGDLPSYLLFRPLSLLLTPLAVALGLSPLAITLAAASMALTLPFVAWLGGADAYLWIAATAFVVHILDCLDGNVARVTRRESRLGGLIDGFADSCFWALLLVSLGILAERGPHPLGNGVGLGLGSALLVILHRHLRDSYAITFGHRAEFSASPPSHLRWPTWLRFFLMSLERLYWVAVLWGGATHRADVVMQGVAVYITIIFCGAVAVTLRAAVIQHVRQG